MRPPMADILRPLALQLLGLLMAILPLVGVGWRALRDGWYNLVWTLSRPLPPKTLEDPRWGTHQYIHLPDVKLHYVEKGDRGKPLMIFLHGFPEFWYSWRYQLEHFAQDYWCVAPDMRGYGDSDKPAGVQAYAIDKLAGDVKNLVEALDRPRCILVAHDWGAAVGYHACTLYPETFSEYIVCNLPHPAAMAEQIRQGWEQRIKSWYIVFFQCPFVPEWFLRLNDFEVFRRMFDDAKADESEGAVEAYKYTYRDSGAFTFPLNYYRCALQYPRDRSNPVKLSVPTLSVFGTADKYLSVAAAEDSRRFVEDFKLVLLEDVSHWCTVEAPERVNAAIDSFLRERNH